jgi:hypothetical protein
LDFPSQTEIRCVTYTNCFSCLCAYSVPTYHYVSRWEFNNHATRSFLVAHGIVLRLKCPYTSQQNDCAERSLRTINDSMCTMLHHSTASPSFWRDALATATYLLSRRPCRVRHHATPHELLLSHPLDYDHLRVFGSLCFPSTVVTSPHKLPRAAHLASS